MSVARAAVRGIAWNMVFGVGSRVLQLIGTLILARFIAPDAYGAVLAASIAIAVAGTLTSFGFGQYLMAHRSGAGVAFQAMILHVMLGVLTMLAVLAFDRPLANWLESPLMTAFIPGFAIAHLLDRIRYVPERLLMRDLRFRAIAMINGASELAFTGVALALAARYGATSIMAGTLARSALATVLFITVSPHEQWLRPSKFHPRTVIDLFRYGVPIMITSVADRFSTRMDSLLMSKLFGSAVMARYNLSYSLAEMPISHVAEHIGEVLMPSYSRMQERDRGPAVLQSAALMTLVVAPLGVGLGAIASTLVATFFDSRWAPMAPMLTLLSIMTVFRPMVWPAVAYLQAIGKTSLLMKVSVLRAFVVLGLVAVLGSLGGPLWATAGACMGYALHSILVIAFTGHATGLSIRSYLSGVLGPMLACAPMFLATVSVARWLDQGSTPNFAKLAVEILAGAVVYVGAAYITARPAFLSMLKLIRNVIRRAPERQ